MRLENLLARNERAARHSSILALWQAAEAYTCIRRGGDEYTNGSKTMGGIFLRAHYEI